MIVTVVTVLVWVWAAGETREKKSINASVSFSVPEPANWVLHPDHQALTIIVEGSQLALQQAESLLRKPLVISVPAAPGRQTVDLLERLRRLDEIRRTGASVLAAEPGLADLELDEIERFSARVTPVLPGVKPEGEVVVDPPEVTVAMPSQLRQRVVGVGGVGGVGQNFAVEAAIDRAELDRLPPGVSQTLEVKLRLPESLAAGNNDVTITPQRVKLTFTIHSRTRETILDSVRIQLAGPPEDRESYVVDIDPKQLRNVIISADADLIRRIESNEVPVVALLHLSSREKEARIESKRISYFIALVPEVGAGSGGGVGGGGGARGVQVNARPADGAEFAPINLKITERGP